MSDSVLRGLVAAAALAVIVAGLRAAATLLAPLAVAGIVAVTSHPLVEWLERDRLPTWAAVLATLCASGQSPAWRRVAVLIAGAKPRDRSPG